LFLYCTLRVPFLAISVRGLTFFLILKVSKLCHPARTFYFSSGCRGSLLSLGPELNSPFFSISFLAEYFTLMGLAVGVTVFFPNRWQGGVSFFCTHLLLSLGACCQLFFWPGRNVGSDLAREIPFFSS